jgi:hypothetical protein
MNGDHPRLRTPNNLSQGGTYDLLLLSFPDGYPQSRIEFDIDYTPRKITGIQKVAQTFLKLLYTSKGSNVLFPNQGTDFQILTVGANIQTTDSIFMSELSACIRSAESQTKSTLNTLGSDSSSMLETVSLLGIDMEKDSVVMYLRMITKAGAKAQVAVPFPELDLKLTPEG